MELGPACPRCAEPEETDDIEVAASPGTTCRRCRHEPLSIDRIVSAWRFGGPLASAIRRLKFAAATQVARAIAPLWSPLIAAAAADGALVVPVPTHWRRRLQRGYDHAWLLAKHACAHAQLSPPLPALRRIRHSPPQSSLPARDRAANVRDAFEVRTAIGGRDIVLLDDVVTTGATIAAAAMALRDAGARSVIGVAIARAGH
jgi:ComF family protein